MTGSKAWKELMFGYLRIIMSAKQTISHAGRIRFSLCVWTALLGVGAAGTVASPQSVPSKDREKKPAGIITVGAERINRVVAALQQKRVALLVNHTSVVDGKRLVDTLRSRGVDIKKIFCPEHGCVGQADAGEAVNAATDPTTGLPLISLYGHAKKPTHAQLENIDVLVFDIQDVGVRFYTYISTLQYAMEACAENDKTIMVLDRPNPNGEYIDGPVLEPKFSSFVGLNPIPVVYGMTIGELALMINGEQWLKGGIKCRISIIEMINYAHTTPYVLPIAPSPNLPTQRAVKWYPSICLFEGTAISLGRGTYSPFEVIGHPDFLGHFAFQFIPRSIAGMAKTPRYENITCYGLSLQNSKPHARISLEYLIRMFKAYPRKDTFFNTFFNKLAGNSTLQEQIRQGMSEKEIRNTWKDGLMRFKKIRARYLIYPD